MTSVCGGCLSLGRRISPLEGEEQVYFNNIVSSSYVMSTVSGVCWECVALLRGAVALQRRVRAATTLLHTLQPHQITPTHSLSHLTIHTTHTYTHTFTHTDTKTEVCVKSEDEYNDDHFVDVNADVDFGDDLKTSTEQNEIIQNEKEEGFASSDDEPLTAHRSRKLGTDREGTDKEGTEKNEGTAKNEGTEKKVKKRRKRKKGEINESKASRRAASLGMPPDAIKCVLLTWEEVSMERARQLATVMRSHALVCTRCALGFNHSHKLQQHMRKHSPSRGPWSCHSCGIHCNTQRALAAHQRRHRLRWQCLVCGSLWSRAAVAADHAARAHQLAAPTHTCNVCGYQANSLGKLRSHSKSHSSLARCPLCDKTLRDAASLRTHLYIHRGEKEHVCPECGKQFTFKKAMQLHRDTHNTTHLYCHQCDVVFKSRMSYYQHMRYNLRHVDPERLKHTCAECGKQFVRAARLAEHRAARHLHITPIHCTVDNCPFSCASRAVLRAHTRSTHSGTHSHRRLVCHRCGKTYTTKKSLESHLKSHETPQESPHDKIIKDGAQATMAARSIENT